MTDSLHGADTSGSDGPYRYGNTRPLTVFLLALSAAVAAIALVYAAWVGLTDATESQRLAEPPDLKGVVARTGAEGRELIRDVREDLGQTRREEDSGIDDAIPGSGSAE